MSKAKSQLTLKIKQLAHAQGLPLPSYQTADAAGMDLIAAIRVDAPITLKPGTRELVPIGLVLELPPGTEAQVRPRSGLAVKHGVTVLNSPGTIDADYRGEVSVLLINLGDVPFVIQRGDRVAQMIIAPVTQARLAPVQTLSATARGTGGFGSTGVAPIKPSKQPSKSKPFAPKRATVKPSSQKSQNGKRQQPSKR